jgi:hypothetical protein
LSLLYFLLPLLKHLLHQPLVLPPLFSKAEKILVMIFLEDKNQKCVFVDS